MYSSVALLPTRPRMRLRRALNAHVHQRADRFQTMRHALAIQRVSFMDEIGE